MFIRSERLFLRPAWPEDWEELYPLINDRSVVHNIVSAPWPCDAQDARDFVQRPQEGMVPHFLVTLPTAAGARIVGAAGLGRHNGELELGCWIARDHWGMGYATEAADAVIEVAKALGHRRVVAGHFVDNPASGRVLEKVGFKPTGELTLRHSRGRGSAAPSKGYAITLNSADDCGDCDCDQDPCRMAA